MAVHLLEQSFFALLRRPWRKKPIQISASFCLFLALIFCGRNKNASSASGMRRPSSLSWRSRLFRTLTWCTKEIRLEEPLWAQQVSSVFPGFLLMRVCAPTISGAPLQVLSPLRMGILDRHGLLRRNLAGYSARCLPRHEKRNAEETQAKDEGVSCISSPQLSSIL